MPKCVYCLNKHPPSQCDKVTDVKARINVLKRFSKCFLCLTVGHVANRLRRRMFAVSVTENIISQFVTLGKLLRIM